MDPVAQFKGETLEHRYRERAHAYFGRLVRRTHVLTSEELSVLLDDAADRGVLSESDRNEVAWADLILSDRWRADDLQVMVLADISSVVDLHVVLRAADRAALLARLGTPVVAVVAERPSPSAPPTWRAAGTCGRCSTAGSSNQQATIRQRKNESRNRADPLRRRFRRNLLETADVPPDGRID